MNGNNVTVFVFEDIGTRGGRSSCSKTELLGTAILLSFSC
jgi:hypothetical protein